MWRPRMADTLEDAWEYFIHHTVLHRTGITVPQLQSLMLQMKEHNRLWYDILCDTYGLEDRNRRYKKEIVERHGIRRTAIVVCEGAGLGWLIKQFAQEENRGRNG